MAGSAVKISPGFNSFLLVSFGACVAEVEVDCLTGEVTILSKLDHPNVVRLIEVVVGRSQLHIFMVMEYAEHELRAALAQEEPEAMRAAIAAAEAAGVEPLELAAARQVMEDSRKPAAVKHLKERTANEEEVEVLEVGALGDTAPLVTVAAGG